MATDNQASLRATRQPFTMVEAVILSRSQLASSEESSCVKIQARLNTPELLAKQSAVPETERGQDGVKHLFEDMLTLGAIEGTAARKFKCPLFFVNFMAQRRAQMVDGDTDHRLFGIYDDETLIQAEQDAVSEIAIDIEMVGVKPGLN